MGYGVSSRSHTHPLTAEFIVCRTMGWDRAQFRRQPLSFIKSIVAHISAESNVQRALQQQQEAHIKQSSESSGGIARRRRG